MATLTLQPDPNDETATDAITVQAVRIVEEVCECDVVKRVHLTSKVLLPLNLFFFFTKFIKAGYIVVDVSCVES